MQGKTRSRTLRTALAAGALVCSTAAWAQGTTLNVSATLQEGCEVVNSVATLSFGMFVPLESTGDRVANTGSTFQVRCTANADPKLYATGMRKLVKAGGGEIPFNLSRVSGASTDDMPMSPGEAIALTSLVKNGSPENVLVYGRIPTSSFLNMPAGSYTAEITLNLTY
jgi:hypothetical protein